MDVAAKPPLPHAARSLRGHLRLASASTASLAWRRRIGTGLRVALGSVDEDAEPDGLAREPDDEASPMDAWIALRDGSTWSAAAGWPRLHVVLGESAVTEVRVAPDAQWEELGEAALDTLDPALRLAIMAHVSAELRRCIGRCLHALELSSHDAPVELAAAPAREDDEGAPQPAPRSRTSVLELRIRLDRQRADARILLPLAALPAPSPHDDAAPHPHFDPWLPCCAVLGVQRLSVRAVLCLRPGDAVLLQTPHGDGAARAWCAVGRQAAMQPTCAMQDLYDGAPGALVALRSDRSLSMSPDQTAINDEIALLAQAVIDTPPQRLSQVQRWRPGDVIALGADVDAENVRLLVGGRTLARGRLATLGDTLAFEIVELFE
jgi:flagellar motor switch/type III secretory pathway protein FliN